MSKKLNFYFKINISNLTKLFDIFVIVAGSKTCVKDNGIGSLIFSTKRGLPISIADARIAEKDLECKST